MNLYNNLPDFNNPPPAPAAPPTVCDAIEEMAAHGFSIAEINEVLRTPDSCKRDAIDLEYMESQEYLAYRKGLLKSQLELRQRIFIDAKNGSSPAQALAKKILDDAEFKLNER